MAADEYEYPPVEIDTAALFDLYIRHVCNYADDNKKVQFAWCECLAAAANTSPDKIRAVASSLYDGLETQLSGNPSVERKK